METDSLPGDVDSLRGGLSLLDPLVDRILGDAVSQQQGWLRVYGKKHTLMGGGGGVLVPVPAGRVSGPGSAGRQGTGHLPDSQVSA